MEKTEQNSTPVKTIYSGPIFDVVQKQMVFNGRSVVRDLVVHPGGAAISAVADGKILLVRQLRAGVEQFTLEIPAGMVDPEEDPKTAAIRELNEETGMEARDVTLLTAFWPTPGYDSEVIYVYEAKGLSQAKVRLEMDDTEEIRIQWMPLDQAWQQVQSGEIRDGKTIIAILYALLQKKNG